MMEVIPINTNENTASKADLWTDRIHAFGESGLSRKDWCQKNGIPQSTLSYWIRKIQSEDTETECISEETDLPPGRRRGISYFVKIRMITYLRLKYWQSMDVFIRPIKRNIP